MLGSRYLHGVTVVNWPMSRLSSRYAANIYTRIVTGLPLQDATGGFKCFRRAVLEAIDLDRVQVDGYAFQIEMSFQAWKKGFRIARDPDRVRRPAEGELEDVEADRAGGGSGWCGGSAPRSRRRL